MNIAILIAQIAVLLVALYALDKYLDRSAKLSQHMSMMETKINSAQRKHATLVEYVRALAASHRHVQEHHLGLSQTTEVFRKTLDD